MKYITSLAFAVAALSSTLPAYASGEGGKEGHGGGVVSVGGHTFLRDLVDPATCEWTKMSDLISGAAHLPALLDSIRKTHWYLAEVIAREATKIDGVCVTNGYLRNVTTKEDENLYTVHRKGTEQIAIRVTNTIFLSKPLYDQLDSVNKAYALVHEISHSLIDDSVPQRAMFLSSLIATIRKNELKPMSREKFALQLEGNQVSITSTCKNLDPYRDSITALMTSQDNAVRAEAALRLGGTFFSHYFDLKVEEKRDLDYFYSRGQVLAAESIREGSREDALKWLSLKPSSLPTGFSAIKDSKGKLLPPFLILAIRRGDIEIIEKTLELPHLNFRESSDYPNLKFSRPLEFAIENKNFEAAKRILNHPAFFEARGTDEGTNSAFIVGSLNSAIKSGNLDLVKDFLKLQPLTNELNQTDETGISPLMAAIIANQPQILAELLKIKGVDVNQRVKKTQESLLTLAVLKKSAALVALLAQEKSIDPNLLSPDENQSYYSDKMKSEYYHSEIHGEHTALHHAVLHAKTDEDYKIIEILLGIPGINVNLVSKTLLKSALGLAVDRNDLKAIRILLKNPNVRIAEKPVFDRNAPLTPWQTAFKRGHWNAIRLMLEHPERLTDLDAMTQIWTDENGFHWSPMGMALLRKDTKLFEALLKIKGVPIAAPVVFSDCWSFDTQTSRWECVHSMDGRTMARKYKIKEMYDYLNARYPSKESCIGSLCF